MVVSLCLSTQKEEAGALETKLEAPLMILGCEAIQTRWRAVM